MIKKVLVLTFCMILFFPTISSGFEQTDIDDNDSNNYLESNRITDFLYLPVIKSLNRIIHPLVNSPLNLSDQNLEFLDFMSDCKILGLGEATHGTKEFFQLKHRIFKYFVEKHDFKIFAFECDMGESYYVDNYVTKGVGDIDNIMKNIMHFWTWRTEEVKDLLLWMRNYNMDKSDENKIHFIGVDCQYITYQAGIIMNYFNKTNVSFSEDSYQFLTEIDEIGFNFSQYYSDMTLNEKNEIDQNVDELLTLFEDSKDNLVSNSSKFEYEFVKQIALNIKQFNDVLYGFVQRSRVNYRDLYMAQNALWSSDLFGEKTKVALWAHNGHVNTRIKTGVMGYHIKKELKDKYQVLGFAFSLGNFSAMEIRNTGEPGPVIHSIKKEPRAGSLNYIFHHAKYKNFILRIADIPLFSFFNLWNWRPRTFITIGSAFGYFFPYYIPTFLKINYDVIINWDVSTAAEQLT